MPVKTILKLVDISKSNVFSFIYIWVKPSKCKLISWKIGDYAGIQNLIFWSHQLTINENWRREIKFIFDISVSVVLVAVSFKFSFLSFSTVAVFCYQRNELCITINTMCLKSRHDSCIVLYSKVYKVWSLNRTDVFHGRCEIILSCPSAIWDFS